MKVLVVGPPMYGLLYPVLSLAQAFRVAGHQVVVGTAGDFSAEVAHAGLTAIDAAPGLDPDAEYRAQEERRKRENLGTKPGGFSFFSDEMADNLVDYVRDWQPDLIVYPPLGVVARLLGAKFDIPTVMQTVGFGHQPWHVDTVTRALASAAQRHGVAEGIAHYSNDLRWIDVAPPSASVLEYPAEKTLAMRYVPFNGGAVAEEWWTTDNPETSRVLVSLGTLKPMVDGLDLITWIIDSADEMDAEFVLQLRENGRAELPDDLPANVRLVDWIPMGDLVTRADLYIHHGGAGNTFTALDAGVPQIVFGEGADRPTNAKIVADRGCGIVPGDQGLSSDMLRSLLDDANAQAAAREVANEMHRMPAPTEVAARISSLVAAI